MNGNNFDFPDPSAFFAQSMEQFGKFWNEANNGFAAGKGMEVPTPDSMRKMRGDFLNAMAASYDEYLRSPAFAEQLRQMLQQGVKAQQKVAEVLGQTRSAWQASSRQDVDSMMEVMQRLERRISDGFERMDERVKAVESAIVGMEAKAGSRPAKKAAAKPAVKAARKSPKKPAKKAARKRSAGSR